MVLKALRVLFLFLGVSITMFFLLLTEIVGEGIVALGFVVSILLTVLVIFVDVKVKREHKIATFSGVLLGMMAGLLFAYALSFVVDFGGASCERQLYVSYQ